jgi:hypothetical protein
MGMASRGIIVQFFVARQANQSGRHHAAGGDPAHEVAEPESLCRHVTPKSLAFTLDFDQFAIENYRVTQLL